MRNELLELILYTLQNQQIFWKNQFYIFYQGIITGAKHSVPLANIFLSYVVTSSLFNAGNLTQMFLEKVQLWKRFVDDISGIFYESINEFLEFFSLLQVGFRWFGLELTCDTDTHNIENGNIIEKDLKYLVFLDMEIFKSNGTLHTREHRKDTASSSYLNIKSAHARHTFANVLTQETMFC